MAAPEQPLAVPARLAPIETRLDSQPDRRRNGALPAARRQWSRRVRCPPTRLPLRTLPPACQASWASASSTGTSTRSPDSDSSHRRRGGVSRIAWALRRGAELSRRVWQRPAATSRAHTPNPWTRRPDGRLRQGWSESGDLRGRSLEHPARPPAGDETSRRRTRGVGSCRGDRSTACFLVSPPRSLRR